MKKEKKAQLIEDSRVAWEAGSGYVRELFNTKLEGTVGRGVELGVGSLVAQSVLRRLPVPFNFIAPFVVEKLIVKHGVEEGREILLRGLRWVKQVTDDKPEKLMVM